MTVAPRICSASCWVTSTQAPALPPALLARAAAGRADDLLTATLLTARCPLLFAPAMDTEMWFHPATVGNVATLRGRGAVVLEPASGRLTGADSGAGRMPEAEEITTLAGLLLERGDALPYDLAGVKVLVSAGGTIEKSIWQQRASRKPLPQGHRRRSTIMF